MIRSKHEYHYYLACDKLALGRKGKHPSRMDYIWKYQRMLRKLEYYSNCKGDLYNLYKAWLRYRLFTFSVPLGFVIPINTIGPGLSIAHRGSIIINKNARIGVNCRLHVGVNIGTAAGEMGGTPVIGDNVYIGPGAKIFGGVEIGDNVAIGANAVVNNDVQGHVTVAGVPAKVINWNGSEGLLVQATECVRESM